MSETSKDSEIPTEKDMEIKKELEMNLEKVAQNTRTQEDWANIDMPEISERELMDKVQANNLEGDEQTRRFCTFISMCSNFASLDFTNRLEIIPTIVNHIKDLIAEIKKEIKEFNDIAIEFDSLIKTFVKLVMNTKHNMGMALPHLKNSICHMNIMADALMPNSEGQLNQIELADLDTALSSMSNGLTKLLDHAKTSKQESVSLDQRIDGLKNDLESKIRVIDNRNSFGQAIPKVGAIVGFIGGACVNSIEFGGVGALVLGGVLFSPTFFLAAAIGTFSIGGIAFLVTKLWEKHQFKSLAYLEKILDELNKLKSANLAFMSYMKRSEEDINQILVNLDSLKENVKNSTPRYRKVKAKICEEAVNSINQMVECIDNIQKIDVSKWSGIENITSKQVSLYLAN